MNRKIEELKPTDATSPILLIKKTDAPSLIPSSPKEIGGMIVFTNIIKLAAHK